jgi:hypothetical protein
VTDGGTEAELDRDGDVDGVSGAALALRVAEPDDEALDVAVGNAEAATRPGPVLSVEAPSSPDALPALAAVRVPQVGRLATGCAA